MIRLHALYLVLGDVEFLESSVRSIYDEVHGITVITTYDRDWRGAPRPADAVVDVVLSRALDPERKIELVVMNETNEARARNRAMDLAAPRGKSIGVRRQHDHDEAFVRPDYFVIIDPDEVYERGTITRLAAYAEHDGRPLYRVAAVRYFQRWAFRVVGHEWSTVLVRADVRLNDLRNKRASVARRGLAFLFPRLRPWLLWSEDVPCDVAVFHHGSYVGPRERIARKLASFGHAAEVEPGWMESVWDHWSPAARDFHPVWPPLFASAEVVSDDELPRDVVEHVWPADYR